MPWVLLDLVNLFPLRNSFHLPAFGGLALLVDIQWRRVFKFLYGLHLLLLIYIFRQLLVVIDVL